MTWILAAASLYATWLNANRVRACFALWLVTNACWCAVNVAAGIYARAALDAVYVGIAAYGWRKWQA